MIDELKPFFKQMDAPRPDMGAFWIDHSLAINRLYHHCRLYQQRRALGTDWMGLLEDAYAGPLWNAHRTQLTKFKNSVEGAGGRLVVVTFPRLHTLSRGAVDLAIMHERLDTLWSQLGIPHLDLLPAIQPHAGMQLVVNSGDAHPSEFTHRLSAQAMLPFLDPHMSP